MGKLHDSIKPAHREFIEQQHIFFVATAPLSADGRVNLSPKGLDCFRVLSEHQVGYMGYRVADVIGHGLIQHRVFQHPVFFLKVFGDRRSSNHHWCSTGLVQDTFSATEN